MSNQIPYRQGPALVTLLRSGVSLVSASGQAAGGMATTTVTLPTAAPPGARVIASLGAWVSGATSVVVRHASVSGTTLTLVTLNAGTAAATYSNLPINWLITT